MFDTFGFVLVVAGVWLAIGLALAPVMHRGGHGSIAWLVVGALTGPFGVVLAVYAARHGGAFEMSTVSRARRRAGGPANVLVGYDESPESTAALDAVVAVLGDRIGRLTAATVVPYGDVGAEERRATDGLKFLAHQAQRRRPGSVDHRHFGDRLVPTLTRPSALPG
jgi:hypothetical protein